MKLEVKEIKQKSYVLALTEREAYVLMLLGKKISGVNLHLIFDREIANDINVLLSSTQLAIQKEYMRETYFSDHIEKLNNAFEKNS